MIHPTRSQVRPLRPSCKKVASGAIFELKEKKDRFEKVSPLYLIAHQCNNVELVDCLNLKEIVQAQ